jgi:hypothetical protein
MEILRSAGTAPGRSQGTAFGEFVWAVATDRTASATIVNAGVKMHRRAGAKIHQTGYQKGPPRGPFLASAFRPGCFR